MNKFLGYNMKIIRKILALPLASLFVATLLVCSVLAVPALVVLLFISYLLNLLVGERNSFKV